MDILLQTEKPPLYKDESGALRVGESRVLLELVLGAFGDGATPEEIVQKYSTLALADVYAVIAYYLRHRADIDSYLNEREECATRVRRAISSRQRDISDLRERLVARKISA